MKKIILIVLTYILITLSCQIFADERKPHSFGPGDTISAEMFNEMFNATSLDLGETLIGIWSTSCLDSKVANSDLDSPGTGTLTINSITPASVSFTGVSCLNRTYSDLSGAASGPTYPRVIQNIKTLGNYALYIQSKWVTNADFTPPIYGYPIFVFLILELTKNRIVLTTPSDGIEVLTRINRVPDPLSSLTYANSSSSITLTWTDSNTEVTGYKVIRKTVVTDNYTTVSTITDNTTRTYADTNVSTGSYWYRVRAYNSNGDGTPSKVIKVEFP